MNKEKNSEIVKKTLSALWWVAVALVAFLMVSVLSAKIKGEVPSVFGYSVLNIVSGSMEPEIEEGTYILVKNEGPENIKKGQIICFYSEDPDIYGHPNTHRVVEEPIVTESGYEFVTRGDANGKDDEVTAKGDRIIGVYVKELGFLSKLSESLGGNTMFIIIAVMMIGLTFMSFYGLMRDGRDGGKKTDEEIAEEAVKEYIAAQAVREYLESKEKEARDQGENQASDENKASNENKTSDEKQEN